MGANDPAGPERAFGPMREAASEDRIIARILAALGQPQAAPTAQPVASMSVEDQRLVAALSSVHPAGRDVIISFREELASHLFFVEYSYQAAAGSRVTVCSLVFDNGERTHVWGDR
jgi:hypothetical protein